MRPHLIFVYNADSGIFNTATDIAHKILSPETYSCNLCTLTHGHFKVRQEWVSFLETLDADCEFLHRDEFHKRHPEHSADSLPAIYAIKADNLVCLIDSDALNQANTLNDLTDMLKTRLESPDTQHI